MGLYPAIDPLDSTSRQLDPLVVGQEHYDVARGVQATLQRYKELKDIIAILGMDELSEADKQVVARARKIERFLTQPYHVAEVFTGDPGVYVPLKETCVVSKVCWQVTTMTFQSKRLCTAVRLTMLSRMRRSYKAD